MQVQTPTGAAPISPYLATQVTQPQVRPAAPPAPVVQKFTAPQVQQSLVDFRAGERAPLGPVKPPVAVQPAPGSSPRPGDRIRL
jgi:hypothetical protein